MILGLAAMAVAGYVLAAYLYLQNVALETRLALAARDLKPAADAGRPRRLREGDALTPFSARAVDGKEMHLAAPGTGPWLLFIYDPACDRCEIALPRWLEVHDRLMRMGSMAHVIGLSIADSYSTVQHTRRARIPYPVVPFPSTDLQRQYGVTEVPLTVVADREGTVKAVWDKPLDEGEVGDVIEVVCPECIPTTVLAGSSRYNVRHSKEGDPE